MPHLKLTQQQIYFAARGASGAPLVFVHGAGDSHLLWNGQLAALSDVARTYALDLPGHGRSTGAGRVTISEYATAVREFLDGVGIERAVIVGSSMGGAIAQTLALEEPSRVVGLVLVGTGAKLRVAPQILEGLQNDFEATARELVELYYADAPPSPPASFDTLTTGSLSKGEGSKTMWLKKKSLEQLLKAGNVVTHGDFVACDGFDVRGQLHMVEPPTLIVCGDGDRMTPPAYSRFLEQVIPNARLEMIAGAGHMVMLEQPMEFERILREWVRENSLYA